MFFWRGSRGPALRSRRRLELRQELRLGEPRYDTKKAMLNDRRAWLFIFRSKCVNLVSTHLKITVELEQQRQEQQLLQQERQRLEQLQRQQEQQLELEQLREQQQHRNHRKLEQLRSRLELERNRSSS